MIKKAICTTTINPPTKALLKYIEIAERDDWTIIIAGDLKTPHDDYLRLAQRHGCLSYIHPSKQQTSRLDELSILIGWNCIQRRNFAILKACELGAEVVAVVDDDNIPYDDWGQNLQVGKTIEVDLYDNPGAVFNPLARFDFGYKIVNMCTDPEQAYTRDLWHRGFPEQDLFDAGKTKSSLDPIKRGKRDVLVQADMWDGDPDISAVARMVLHPDVKFHHTEPYAGVRPGPFNSQNTFIHRKVLPYYFLFPHIGRMDDIWASYVVQKIFPDSVIYGTASVYQERNPHDLSKDLEAELIGYRHTPALIKWLFKDGGDPLTMENWPSFMPRQALLAYNEWRTLIAKMS